MRCYHPPEGRWEYHPARCGGCLTDHDRALWQQLADEIAAYLAAHDVPGLR